MEYHPKKLNNVADVLSLRDTELLPTALGDDRPGDDVRAAACALFGPSFALNNDIHTSTREAPDAQLLTYRLQEGTLSDPWRLEDGLLLHTSRIFVPVHNDLRHQVLLLAHSVGYEGI